MTSLFSHNIILVLFWWIIKHDYNNKYLVIGDWSQSTDARIIKRQKARMTVQLVYKLNIVNLIIPEYFKKTSKN